MQERLRVLRDRAGLSARELSSLAGLKSPNHVSHLEAGIWTPTTRTATALAQVVGCSLDWLVNGRGEPPTDASLLVAVEAARAARAADASEGAA